MDNRRPDEDPPPDEPPPLEPGEGAINANVVTEAQGANDVLQDRHTAQFLLMKEAVEAFDKDAVEKSLKYDVHTPGSPLEIWKIEGYTPIPLWMVVGHKERGIILTTNIGEVVTKSSDMFNHTCIRYAQFVPNTNIDVISNHFVNSSVRWADTNPYVGQGSVFLQMAEEMVKVFSCLTYDADNAFLASGHTSDTISQFFLNTKQLDSKNFQFNTFDLLGDPTAVGEFLAATGLAAADFFCGERSDLANRTSTRTTFVTPCHLFQAVGAACARDFTTVYAMNPTTVTNFLSMNLTRDMNIQVLAPLNMDLSPEIVYPPLNTQMLALAQVLARANETTLKERVDWAKMLWDGLNTSYLKPIPISTWLPASGTTTPFYIVLAQHLSKFSLESLAQYFLCEVNPTLFNSSIYDQVITMSTEEEALAWLTLIAFDVTLFPKVVATSLVEFYSYIFMVSYQLIFPAESSRYFQNVNYSNRSMTPTRYTSISDFYSHTPNFWAGIPQQYPRLIELNRLLQPPAPAPVDMTYQTRVQFPTATGYVATLPWVQHLYSETPNNPVTGQQLDIKITQINELLKNADLRRNDRTSDMSILNQMRAILLQQSRVFAHGVVGATHAVAQSGLLISNATDTDLISLGSVTPPNFVFDPADPNPITLPCPQIQVTFVPGAGITAFLGLSFSHGNEINYVAPPLRNIKIPKEIYRYWKQQIGLAERNGISTVVASSLVDILQDNLNTPVGAAPMNWSQNINRYVGNAAPVGIHGGLPRFATPYVNPTGWYWFFEQDAVRQQGSLYHGLESTTLTKTIYGLMDSIFKSNISAGVSGGHYHMKNVKMLRNPSIQWTDGHNVVRHHLRTTTMINRYLAYMLSAAIAYTSSIESPFVSATKGLIITPKQSVASMPIYDVNNPQDYNIADYVANGFTTNGAGTRFPAGAVNADVYLFVKNIDVTTFFNVADQNVKGYVTCSIGTDTLETTYDRATQTSNFGLYYISREDPNNVGNPRARGDFITPANWAKLVYEPGSNVPPMILVVVAPDELFTYRDHFIQMLQRGDVNPGAQPGWFTILSPNSMIDMEFIFDGPGRIRVDEPIESVFLKPGHYMVGEPNDTFRILTPMDITAGNSGVKRWTHYAMNEHAMKTIFACRLNNSAYNIAFNAGRANLMADRKIQIRPDAGAVTNHNNDPIDEAFIKLEDFAQGTNVQVPMLKKSALNVIDPEEKLIVSAATAVF